MLEKNAHSWVRLLGKNVSIYCQLLWHIPNLKQRQARKNIRTMPDKHGQTSWFSPSNQGASSFPLEPNRDGNKFPKLQESRGVAKQGQLCSTPFWFVHLLGFEACYVWVVSCCINVLQCFAWPAVAETSIYAKFSKILEMKEWKWWQVAGFVQKGSSPATTIQIALKLPLVWNVFLWQLIGWFSRLLSWRYL